MKKEIATFGGGCFWCIEAVIQQLKGVESVVSGYAGGIIPGPPTYREVCSGLSGYAEVIQVNFDSDQLPFSDLIKIFMTSHDPTQLNQQGADSGTQYRSVIYYYSEVQKQEIEQVFDEVKIYYTNPIVTEVTEAPTFFPAEEDHQNFYNENSGYGYCRVVIDPKISRLRKMYGNKLKD